VGQSKANTEAKYYIRLVKRVFAVALEIPLRNAILGLVNGSPETKERLSRARLATNSTWNSALLAVWDETD
jgi:hypothetical protein